MKQFVAFIAVLSLAVFFSIQTAQAESTFVSIGTGGISGVYYPTGGAIAKMINKKRAIYGFRATVKSTGGSVDNITAIMAGDLDFGVVQSDSQYQAVKGIAVWQDQGPQGELRAVFSIHPEAVTLIAAFDAGIKNINDLKGKRVNIGHVGSGQGQNAIDALTAIGIQPETDIQSEYVDVSEAADLLQKGKIDAFFYTVGHPSGFIKKATSGARRVVLADITGVDSLIDKFSYYAETIIPVALYPGAQNERDVETFGVRATLVTSAEMSDDIVYAITKEVFDNLEFFKKLHPAYATLTRESMLTGLSAPIHPGAIKYFKEVGLVE